jgi:hypothetical protein
MRLKMSERWAVVRVAVERYRRVGKKQKGQILNERKSVSKKCDRMSSVGSRSWRPAALELRILNGYSLRTVSAAVQTSPKSTFASTTDAFRVLIESQEY